eukprot:CAMPEP_0114624268 /NCGR_PEP_ID=MMETSP0168-20121206/10681_1 /TAXON_ID=95228 ORGANISM="Vannella sp., Strain DIVA3 517/6/12" /NCGR_SAMPLE_ID=MMETSP0168 /ASSEMBLY_ACC=CAM_ASM_000044 /LENGTH=576 /DNA_ID=CAMNT_0001835541 /DNA_START=103 /DNA_END=1830 /DNA_ORIENTATION=-
MEAGIVDSGDLQRLFSYYTGTKRLDSELQAIQEKVNKLFKCDYVVSTISNREGELCTTYPPEIVVIERERLGDMGRMMNDAVALASLMEEARFARVRARFPVPVLTFRGKNLCRSSTLSQKIECIIQNVHNSKMSYASVPFACMNRGEAGTPNEDELMQKTRAKDIELIQALHVNHICDLMVENKKNKYFINVSSSEKIDSRGRYADFSLSSIPFPGCEFFKDFKENHHNAQDLCFDWSSLPSRANLHLAKSIAAHGKGMEHYKEWDLLLLTQNYLRLQLAILVEKDSSGLLVHCISGWDRTPLFVSLIRLSLWADGEVHQSLGAKEVLYLTLAYDWLLFRHKLLDRTNRGEDIFYYCFYFLQFISGPEFSIDMIEKDVNGASSSSHTSRKRSSSSARQSETSPARSPRGVAIAPVTNTWYIEPAAGMTSPRIAPTIGSYKSPSYSVPLSIPANAPSQQVASDSSVSPGMSSISGSVGSWEFVSDGAQHMEAFMASRGPPPSQYLSPPNDTGMDDDSEYGRPRQDSCTSLEEESFFALDNDEQASSPRAANLQAVREEFMKIYGDFVLRSSSQSTS